METANLKLRTLQKAKGRSYWADRIVSELEYLNACRKTQPFGADVPFEEAVEEIYQKNAADGTILQEDALRCEEKLRALSGIAKARTLFCAAHAHIDMNWMWRWDETVSVVLDTFKTMLDLMNDYPEYKFSQSQASIYRIVEEYCPEMLEEIKKRVREGRWEAAASTWVEADKNMPSGESQARHLLYTRRYLSGLLGIEPASLDLDFEPDTFGHSVQVPEILAEGGVRYYYHTRGRENDTLYRWEGPSGASLVVFNDPFGYSGDITSSIVMYLPEFADKHRTDCMLYVYGVGDHGGGPSRRDIERILDMNRWPLFPHLKCATYHEFFRRVEKEMDTLPVVKGELNYIFTGCYSSQSLIKEANRVGEAALVQAETFSTACSLCGGRYPAEKFADAWKRVLFNQFHDIITGSGCKDTRNYALGEFQKAMAAVNTIRTDAVRKIAANIDTSEYLETENSAHGTVSEGKGAAYGVGDFKISQVCRGNGRIRIFHVFNSSLFDRTENVEIEIWDWEGDRERIRFEDGEGNPVPFQLFQEGTQCSWGGEYFTALLEAKVPACGYNTYILSQTDDFNPACSVPGGKTHAVPAYRFENEYLSVTFDPVNAAIVSLKDRKTGAEYADPKRPAGVFRYIEENTTRGMTAWIVGPYMNIHTLAENVMIRRVQAGPALIRQSIEYTVEFQNSSLNVCVYLDRNSKKLVYDVRCEWREIGRPGDRIPQLGFYMPLPYHCASYKYDVPCGVLARPDADDDRPATSFTVGVNGEADGAWNQSIMVTTASKYGFRTTNDSIAVTLLRSSYDPDPYPEVGSHRMVFSVGLVQAASNRELIEEASRLGSPLQVISAKPSKGEMPRKNSFMEILKSGTGVVSGVKMPEDGDGRSVILRLYEADGVETESVFRFFKKVRNAYYTDIHENRVERQEGITVDGERLSVRLKPCSVATVCVFF